MSDSLQVWVDADFREGKLQIGTLAQDRSTMRFAYDPTWLRHPLSFAIDPDLSLGEVHSIHNRTKEIFASLTTRRQIGGDRCS